MCMNLFIGYRTVELIVPRDQDFTHGAFIDRFENGVILVIDVGATDLPG